jgi:hypothetical protein
VLKGEDVSWVGIVALIFHEHKFVPYKLHSLFAVQYRCVQVSCCERGRELDRDRPGLTRTSESEAEFDSALTVNRLDVDRDGPPRLYLQPCADPCKSVLLLTLDAPGPNRVLALQKQYQVAIMSTRAINC